MNIYEFIFKTENNQGLKAVNFDDKELVSPAVDGMPEIPLTATDGVGVIKLSSRRKLKDLTDLRYYAVAKNKDALDKLTPLLDNYFINTVYVLNDGQIAALLTNVNQEKIVITDVALDNNFTVDNSIESLIAWFKTPTVEPTPVIEEPEEAFSIDDLNQFIPKEDPVKNTPKITLVPQPTKEFGAKVILVVDRFVKDETIRKGFALNPNKKLYDDCPIYNFYTLLDNEGNSYMLECIAIVEQMKLEPDNRTQLYNQFKAVCKAWFDKTKSLGVTDICCRRVFKSDRNLTPEIVIWLWGYFVLGQKCNWILSNGALIRSVKNEFYDIDTKEGRFYEGEARKALSANKPYTVNLPAQYMTVGCANYLVDTGYPNDSIEWKSGNVSFESHLAGAMGNYNRTSTNLEQQLEMLANSSKPEIYKNFVKSYYNIGD